MTSGADPIECLERVELAPDAQLGTVLRATRAIAAGDVVLRERPLVVSAGYADLMRQAGGGIDMDNATKFLLLGYSHGFAMGDPSAPYGMDLSLLPNEYQERRGLMRLGGFMAPSCAPNCMRSARATPGYMTLVATRAIAAGDAVTRDAARLADTTKACREETLLSRGVACACARCAAPDLAFSLPCPAAAAGRCRGTLAPMLPASSPWPAANPADRAYVDGDELAAWTWQCSRCALRLHGRAMLPRLQPASALSQRLEALDAALPYSDMDARLHAPLTALIADARRELCATHIVVHRALKTLAMLYVCTTVNYDDIAAARLSDDDGSVISSRARVLALAAKTEMDALRVLECTVAGCDCGAECNANHQIIKDGIPYTMNAVKSLQHASAAAAAEAPGTAVAAAAPAAAAAAIAAARCPRLVPHLRRYVPFFAATVGAQSDEALDMAAALGVLPGGDAPLYCANCLAVSAEAAALKSCGRCRCVRYCSAACQRAHYARHHKRVCKRLAALASEHGGGGGAGGAAPMDFSGIVGVEGDSALRIFR
ncbi:hypothetical protein JKP88DRAFT_351257 [Tribonema minus]|uniref:MYND-type domain-containing protein n=1 Tax=Tribonema minus TaxID=303371 RepID=A0A835YII0_9STRA|nr:hypothetical protein JKP88DRAFT_351257 [Tribonema minus]